MENFSVSPRKKLEKYPDCQERHVRNWVTESEKSGFFFQKSSKKAKKLWKQTEKFLTLHRKKAGKIIPTKRKNLRKRMIRMKKQQIIFCKRTEKMQKRMRGRTEKSAVASEKI